MKSTYEANEFCVQCERSSDATGTTRNWSRARLQPELTFVRFFIHDRADYRKKETDSPGEVELTIPGLKVADDVTVCSLTIPRLQKGIHQIAKFCKNWSSKCNLKEKKLCPSIKGKV